MSALSAVVVEPDIRWNPGGGRSAMYCLIGAESAIFAIFVVAYIFFIGKSLTGPQPRTFLQIPVFATICLLASSLTIHAAVKLLRPGGCVPLRRIIIACYALSAQNAEHRIRNIVLVHGAWADGSGWKGRLPC